jgi:hypothetical protein
MEIAITRVETAMTGADEEPTSCMLIRTEVVAVIRYCLALDARRGLKGS